MSDYDVPDLPSDDELGITDQDREALEELPEERPEMSADEMSALLGEVFSQDADEAAPPDPKAEKKRKRKERKEQKKQKKQEKAAKPADAPQESPTAVVQPGVVAPRSRWRGPITAAILLLVAAVSSTKTGLPRPVQANAADTAFSSSRAMAVLIEIAAEPHPTGSPEHARVREFLVDRLRSLGLDPQVQTTTAISPITVPSTAATVRNIVARIPGTAPTGAVLLMAHYDTRELAPGAGDDGSGVVTILEAIRAMQAGTPLRNDVIVLLTDGEELGLIGAQAFLDEHPWMEDVSLALTFEMRGAGGPSIMVETNDQNGWVVRALKAAVPRAFANSLSDEIYKRMPNFTDFTPMKQVGVQGMMFAAGDNAHVYHQATDSPENLDEASLQHHGLHALGLLRYLGVADLTNVNAASVVAFNIPLLGLTVHSGSWVLPLTGAILVILLGAMLVAVRAGARLWAVIVGLGLAVVSASLGYGAGAGLLGWHMDLHAETGSLDGSVFHGEGWLMLSLACAAVAVVTTLHAIARRWLSIQELALGAVLIPAAAAAWLSFSMPLGAPNLQWPTLAAALSILILAVLGARSSGIVAWIVTLLLALPALALLVPLTELVWVGMTFRLAGVLGATMVAILWLALPALDSLRHPNSWWAPLTALTLGAGALGLGFLAARPDAEAPAPSTLVYTYEHDSPEGVWITSPVTDSLDVPARNWAVGRTGSAFGLTVDMASFGYRPGDVPATAAPAVDVPRPTIVIQSDTTLDGRRLVTLGVRSEIGAEMLRFQSDPGSETRLRSINGRALDASGLIEHWGMPDTMVVLELEMPAGSAIGLEIVEHLLRPYELLGAETFQRPPDLAPDVSRMSDRAMIKTSFMPGSVADSTAAPSDSLSVPAGVRQVPADSPPVPSDTSLAAPDTTGLPSDTIRP